MIPENERARRGKAPPIQNERPRGAAGIPGEEEQQRATQTDKKPPTPYYLPSVRAITWVGGQLSELCDDFSSDSLFRESLERPLRAKPQVSFEQVRLF